MARKVSFYNYLRKKQRGQKRKLNKLIDYVNKFETDYTSKYLYQCFRVPCSIDFINSKKTSGKVKSEFCRAWLQKTKHFIEQRPDDNKFMKIVAIISVSDLWSSQINIFYDEEYYLDFFKRNTNLEEHILINDKSFKKSRNINSNLYEMGLKENYSWYDEEILVVARKERWFYGEFPLSS